MTDDILCHGQGGILFARIVFFFYLHIRHNSRLAGVINSGNSWPSIWRELRALRVPYHNGPRRGLRGTQRPTAGPINKRIILTKDTSTCYLNCRMSAVTSPFLDCDRSLSIIIDSPFYYNYGVWHLKKISAWQSSSHLELNFDFSKWKGPCVKEENMSMTRIYFFTESKELVEITFVHQLELFLDRIAYWVSQWH